MKVLTEKKATLSIYTEPDYSTDKKMECEVNLLRRELDETRAALRLQTVRCRQLVAEYSARLRERDKQIRAGNALRDHQLALVLRALLALEARLRREQKAIRAQLAHRDAVIHQQQLEITRLRGQSPRRPPAPPVAATPSELIVVNHTCGKDSLCHDEAVQSKVSKKRSKCKEEKYIKRDSHETIVDASHLRKHQEATLRVLELVDPTRDSPGTPIPLLNGDTARIVDAGIEPPADFIEDVTTPPPDVVESYNEMNKECLELASMAASLRGDAEKNGLLTPSPRGLARLEYQDNPVLECVNLILLRDQEDFQEERRRTVECSNGLSDHLESLESPAWYHTKEKASSPPQRAQVLQEKECLRMSSQKLTVVRAADLEDIDAAGRKTPPRPPAPALPPKPARLMGLVSTRTKPPPPVRTTAGDGSKTNLVKKSRTDMKSRPNQSRMVHEQDIPHLANGSSSAPTSPIAETGPAHDKVILMDAGDVNDALRRNFEEFNLDDCEIEGLGEDADARLEGDGAESRNHVAIQDIMSLASPAPEPVTTIVMKDANDSALNANYDTFLEATGLSNKSILTPSRMLSNHRSVLKPKDVKHRSRVKAERCLTSMPAVGVGVGVGVGPTVKYWTEPFL